MEESGGNCAFQSLPDEFDGVELGTVRWQEDQTDVKFGCTRSHSLSVMDRTIIENHEYRKIRTAFTPYILQERTHILRLG